MEIIIIYVIAGLVLSPLMRAPVICALFCVCFPIHAFLMALVFEPFKKSPVGKYLDEKRPLI